MRHHNLKATVVCIVLVLFVAVPVAIAEMPQSNESTEALLELLVEKGVLSKEEADIFKNKVASPDAAEDTVNPGKTIHLGASTEESTMSETEASEEIKRVEDKVDRMLEMLLQNDRLAERQYEALEDKVGSDLQKKIYSSSWAQRITIGGDIRLRYEGNMYDEENAYFLDPSDTSSLLNSTVDQHRGRYRLRLDTKAKLVDSREINVGKAEVGIRLSTGNDDNPISTNDTFGDYQNKDGILIDRAYLKWTYSPIEPFWGILPQVAISGGRIANPWFTGSSLVWDHDLNFEGVVMKFKSDTQDWRKWGTFLTIGGFTIQEEELSHDDKYMLGAQLGVEWLPNGDFTGTLSAAYYDYINIEGVVNSTSYPDLYDFTAPEYQTKGNTLIDIDPTSDIQTALAADYNLVNVTLKADYTRFYPINLSMVGEGVYNIGFDKDAVAEKTGADSVPEEVLGYHIGFSVGYPTIRQFGEWSTTIGFRYLESDAVLDAFSDSDFHGGGTNGKGWLLAIWYGLYEDIWMKFNWWTTDEASDSSPQFAIDTVQVDISARF